MLDRGVSGRAKSFAAQCRRGAQRRGRRAVGIFQAHAQCGRHNTTELPVGFHDHLNDAGAHIFSRELAQACLAMWQAGGKAK